MIGPEYGLFVDGDTVPRLKSTNMIYLLGRGQQWQLQKMISTFEIKEVV